MTEHECARCCEILGTGEEWVEQDGEFWHPECWEQGRRCDACVGAEEVLVEQARQFKTKGWDPEEDGYGRYGVTYQCTECGRAFDFDAADAAYAASPGPETPTGSQADEVRRLAGDLGLDLDDVEKLLQVCSRRPMA